MSSTFNLIKNITPYLNFISSLGFNSNNKNQIIDPFSTAIKICLLIYKPLYTKLSISENRIYFQEPNLYQGTRRTLNGDQGSDIYIIINSIENLLLWYKISDKNIRYICIEMIKGLEKISKCYHEEDDKKIISQTINFFIEKIQRKLENNEEEEEIQTHTSDHNIYYDFFKKQWNEREIIIIFNQLQELDLDQNKDKQISLIKSIEEFLNYKDNETYKYINNLTKY